MKMTTTVIVDGLKIETTTVTVSHRKRFHTGAVASSDPRVAQHHRKMLVDHHNTKGVILEENIRVSEYVERQKGYKDYSLRNNILSNLSKGKRK